MCSRYVRKINEQKISKKFNSGRLLGDASAVAQANYNIAPTTFQPVIRVSREGEREVVLMRWGLVPHFTKQLSEVKGVSTINARAETVETSAMWRGPLRRRRCLVPADGFYEWKKLDAKTKQPWMFSMRDGEPFAFAGLWDAWKEPVGEGWLQSFSIITTEPNELTATVHNRMPVIVRPQDYERWLDRGETERPPVELLRPFDAEAMTAWTVDPRVGNVRNNGPELCEAWQCPPNSA